MPSIVSIKAVLASTTNNYSQRKQSKPKIFSDGLHCEPALPPSLFFTGGHGRRLGIVPPWRDQVSIRHTSLDVKSLTSPSSSFGKYFGARVSDFIKLRSNHPLSIRCLQSAEEVRVELNVSVLKAVQEKNGLGHIGVTVMVVTRLLQVPSIPLSDRFSASSRAIRLATAQPSPLPSQYLTAESSPITSGPEIILDDVLALPSANEQLVLYHVPRTEITLSEAHLHDHLIVVPRPSRNAMVPSPNETHERTPGLAVSWRLVTTIFTKGGQPCVCIAHLEVDWVSELPGHYRIAQRTSIPLALWFSPSHFRPTSRAIGTSRLCIGPAAIVIEELVLYKIPTRFISVPLAEVIFLPVLQGRPQDALALMQPPAAADTEVDAAFEPAQLQVQKVRPNGGLRRVRSLDSIDSIRKAGDHVAQDIDGLGSTSTPQHLTRPTQARLRRRRSFHNMDDLHNLEVDLACLFSDIGKLPNKIEPPKEKGTGSREVPVRAFFMKLTESPRPRLQSIELSSKVPSVPTRNGPACSSVDTTTTNPTEPRSTRRCLPKTPGSRSWRKQMRGQTAASSVKSETSSGKENVVPATTSGPQTRRPTSRLFASALSQVTQSAASQSRPNVAKG